MVRKNIHPIEMPICEYLVGPDLTAYVNEVYSSRIPRAVKEEIGKADSHERPDLFDLTWLILSKDPVVLPEGEEITDLNSASTRQESRFGRFVFNSSEIFTESSVRVDDPSIKFPPAH